MANKFFQDMVMVKREKEAKEGKVYKPLVVDELKVKKEQPKVQQREQSRENLEVKKIEPKIKREVPPPEDAFYVNSSENKPKYVLWIVALVAVGFLFFAVSYIFSKAIITVSPKTHDSVLNENLNATKDSNLDDLSFHLVEISGEETKTLETTEQKDVIEKATGTVAIFNSYSTASQPLSIDTRLEGTNGKIYKTLTKITVPGKSATGAPGSVEVPIYAVEPGSTYNSSPMDFTIVGFKGTPKYTKFVVRSKGDITGGQQGKAPAITDEDKGKVVADLKTSLEAKLLKQATDQIPEGFILYKDAVFLNTDESNIQFSFSGDSSVPVKLSGTLYGLLLDKNKLTKKIAKDAVSKYDGSPVEIENLENLKFSLSNKDNVSFADITNINFNLSGPAKIIWSVDEDKLRGDLLGKSKNEFNQILLKYPNIDSATLVVSPFWKISIPDKAKDVHININTSK